MNYHTDTVNFFFWGGALISKVLVFGRAFFREGRLSESGRSLDHLRYSMKTYVLLHFEHKNDFTIVVKVFCEV